MSLFDEHNDLTRISSATPEQLAARMAAVASNENAPADYVEREVADIVRQAEAGGSAHMAAVAEVVARIPNGPPPPNAPVYEASTGRPAWNENNILMSLEVRIDGRVYTARESLDPMMMAIRFGGPDTERFESFVEFFIKRSFGAVALADDESYRFLRDRLWIVRPGDEHDLKRCHDSHQPEHNLKPACTMGIITTKPFKIVPGEYDPVSGATSAPYAQVDKTAILGVCSCRCHRKDFYGNGSKRFAALNGLAVFDELMVDEEGNLR
jgi:hypothetical protein